MQSNRIGWLGRVVSLLGLLSSLSWSAHAQESTGLRLVPFPKEVRRSEGRFRLNQPLRLELHGEGVVTEALARELDGELRRAGWPGATLVPGEGTGCLLRLAPSDAPRSDAPALPANPAPEAYALDVRATGVVAVARESAGLVCAVQTLRQLIRANRDDTGIPCVTATDWPSLRWRGFQDDLTRGPSSTLATLMFEAGLGAYLKLNLMTYYMESQYAFAKHPRIGPPDGSLTGDDLAALVKFAQPWNVAILGNQQSFGHFGRILALPEYAGLRETPDILTPVREETYQLLDDFYGDVCPRLPFPWFNVCCDETYGLGTGPAKALADRIGVGGVYVGHVRRVHDLLRDRHGKRMMMWGDIILQHPDRLAEVPRDTIMLTWGYDARGSFEDQIVPFARSGFEFFICPGVNNWSRIMPDFGVAVTNIQNFVRDGVKHGALGMINTDWEDDGEAINAVKWHADAWAAECAWNGSTTSYADFNRCLGGVLFGEAGDRFGQAIARLTPLHRLSGMNGLMNARFWESDFVPRTRPAAVQAVSSNLLAAVRPALADLTACQAGARANQAVLAALAFGARRIEVIGQRMQDGLVAAELYARAATQADARPALEQIEALIKKQRDAHEQLGRDFAALWRAENRPYALDWTLQRYTNAVASYDALRGRVVAARHAVDAGQPLPDAGDVGLALPRTRNRLRPPDVARGEPLDSTRPWSVPASAGSLRFGVEIEAGAVDRFNLPVELELRLSTGIASGPCRAFRLDADGSSHEVPAQIDALESGGRGRLSLVLPGLTPAGSRVRLWVYPGSPPTDSAQAAVSSRLDGNDRVWLENERVHLLIGSEGAHVYRWELKTVGGRDLTMPGETGWAGFSDMGHRRSARYRLRLTANGPAMAECECEEEGGATKTIRLFAGASWIEVFLSEPTSVYWDFDDPKNFAADGPTPGTWRFSNGDQGPVGREADGVPGQVRRENTRWGLKENPGHLALGLITPGQSTHHLVAPGAGAGGVGIESSPPAGHFVTFAGVIDGDAATVMNRLETTLDLRRPVKTTLYAPEKR